MKSPSSGNTNSDVSIFELNMVRIMFYLLYQRKTLFFTHLTCDAFAGGDEPSTDVDDAGGFEKMEKNERRAFDRNFFLHFVVCFVC